MIFSKLLVQWALLALVLWVILWFSDPDVRGKYRNDWTAIFWAHGQ